MTPSVAWYPDPTGRYSHRWWDGETWTPRVYAGGTVVQDPAPVVVPSGQKLHCGVCHAAARTADWRSRCHRCTVRMTIGYVAPKPRREFKAGELLQAAQVSFEGILLEVDRALAAGDDAGAVRRLDTAITYGTVLRAIAASSKAKRAAEPLTLAALIELHLQAIRLHARFAASFDPQTFELTLLLRLAAMYAPEGRDDLPSTAGELVAFSASRVAWAETECARANELAAHYASAFDWPSLQVALARVGYEFEDKRRAASERGRIEAAALLGVDADGRPSAIKKAYYREAAKHHPDRLGEAPDDIRMAAEERMKEINRAYELLTA